MESDNSHPSHSGSAITVTTKIIRSEAPLMTDPSNPRRGSECHSGEEQQQNGAKARTVSKLGSRAEPLSTEKLEDTQGPCANPVLPDKRRQNALPSVGLQSGFEESPEWRQYYDPSSKLSKVYRPYLPEGQNQLQPNQSFFNTNNFPTEAFITAKTLSDRSSIDTELSSKRLLCLPRPPSRRNLLKAGNLRLKQLIKPKGKGYFRTQPVVENEQGTVGQLQKLDLTASRKDVQRKESKGRMDKIGQDGVERPWRAVRNKESATSIINLNQFETNHRLEKPHPMTLSESWDEMLKNMGGFRADSAAEVDDAHHGAAQSSLVGIGTNKLDIPPSSDPASKHETTDSQNVPARLPPLPGPRTSSMSAMMNASSTFQVVAAEPPAQSTPPRQSKPQSTNQVNLPTETDANLTQVEQSLIPRLREVRSSEGLSRFGPPPDASQSTIALETIEAEMTNSQPLSPSIVTQAFSFNCTPAQPITAPTDPPVGPLPELPEEFDKADAASRVSSHHSTSTRLSRPVIPPRSPHRRNSSANSASSKLTLRQVSPQKVHHRKNSSLSTLNSKRPTSIREAQNLLAGGNSSRISTHPKFALSVNNNAIITGFNQYNLGNSQDLRSPAASEAGQENEMVDTSGTISAKSSLLTNDVVSSRTEHIKSLKLRDLAKEKATKSRSRRHHSDLDDTIVVEKPATTAEDVTSQSPQHSNYNVLAGKPLGASDINSTGISRPANRQDSVKRRPSYQSRRTLSNRTPQKAGRPTMSQSQIMVLAETNPDTQTFRASTPTGSLRRIDSKKAETTIPVKERRITKRKSKTSIRSQIHASATARGIPVIKPNGEHTPPHTDPSIYSSDDEDNIHRSSSQRSINHIAALVKEDSDLESAPSKRAFAALARKEEKRYLKEQLLLKKLKRESSELKLAMRLLSRGLEKLTTFVKADEELSHFRGYGLIEAEMEPVKGMAERRFQGRGAITVSPDSDRNDWAEFEQSAYSRRQAEDDIPGAERRSKSVRTNDARPVSLVSRYSSVRNSMGESVLSGPPIKDEMIWSQVDGLNRANMVRR